MIDVTQLTKSFGSNHVLAGVDLHVEEGEVVAIIGPSGSGKSTLLRCLNLLEQPDTGTITIDGATVTAPKISRKEAAALRSKTAMVFQQYNLFRNKRALENVTEALIVGQRIPKAKAVETAKEILDRVGILPETQMQYPNTLSGGQQQRVSIARALAVAPRAILFDEPTSALDPELVAGVLAVMRQLAEERTTMVIVTHEISFAAEVADTVIFIDGGVIVEQGPPSQVIENPQNERTQRFLSEARTAPRPTAKPREKRRRGDLGVQIPLA